MRRLLLLAAVLFLGGSCFAQAGADDSPATKEDVQRYLQAIHSHDMMKKIAVSMAQGMRQMLHDQYLKDKDSLPSDYESRMTERMDGLFENMPWDQMLDAMAPVYERHFTKGDINNLVAFYSSPTGEKLLREMPSIMTESMKSATPIMLKYMDTVKQTLQKETDDMIAQSRKQPLATGSPTKN